jgi:hypothetical protein
MVREGVSSVALLVLLCTAVLVVQQAGQAAGQIAEDPHFNVSKIESFFNSSGRFPSTQPHSNNWAVLVPPPPSSLLLPRLVAYTGKPSAGFD